MAALKYAQSKGGVLIQHGQTHQYNGLVNPYNQVTGDDFEFFQARCSVDGGATYTTCTDDTPVILLGAIPGQNANNIKSRVSGGRSLMQNAGLGTPTIFETPHYSASALAYTTIGSYYGTRYERELFFGGTLLSGNSSARFFGQFFPYRVVDVYGTTMLPETMGNYEPLSFSNHPPRLVPDLLANATANSVVTTANASFFFHLDYPVAELAATVEGVQGQGYTFVTPTQLN